jgi:hypothetical protein
VAADLIGSNRLDFSGASVLVAGLTGDDLAGRAAPEP